MFNCDDVDEIDCGLIKMSWPWLDLIEFGERDDCLWWFNVWSGFMSLVRDKEGGGGVFKVCVLGLWLWHMTNFRFKWGIIKVLLGFGEFGLDLWIGLTRF